MTGAPSTPTGRTVLIFRIGSLGDSIVALPSFHLIANAFPDSTRLALTHAPANPKAASLATILGGSGLVQGFIEYNQRESALGRFFRLRREIKRLGVDTLIYLPPVRTRVQVWRDKAFFRLCGIKTIVGTSSKSDSRGSLRIPGSDKFASEAMRLLKCLSPLGEVDVSDPRSWDLMLTDEEIQAAEEALHGLDPRQRTLALSVGTKQPANEWGEANWTGLVQRLRVLFQGWNLIFLGAADEHDRSQGLAQGWPGKAMNLCGTLSPRASAAALRSAHLFVGHDSGPLHLAAAMAVPCVGIFSARNPPGIWFPQGSGHQIIYHSVPCAGCGLVVCTRNQHCCMTSITVDEVVEAVDRARMAREHSEREP